MLRRRASVETWSSRQLQYGPKQGWQKGLRAEIAEAVSSVEAEPGSRLHAVHGRDDPRATGDVENVLFYNVGMSLFAHLMRGGVQFEQSCVVPEGPRPQPPGGFHHYHLYEQQPVSSAGFRYWRATAVLASWEKLAWPKDASTVTGWWYHLRTHGVGVERQTSDSGPIGLELTLSTPSRLHVVLKPMLDGLICSLHAHDGSDMQEVTNRLAERLACGRDEVATLLLDERVAVLGRRRLLRPFRNSVKWNPADDRCKAVSIRIAPSHPGQRFGVTGRIFTVCSTEVTGEAKKALVSGQ